MRFSTALAIPLLASTIAAASSSPRTISRTVHRLAPRQADQNGGADNQYEDDETFQRAMLETHNRYRSEHNVTDLSWNETSAEFAAEWAERCVFEHSGGPTGENLSAGYANATAAVEVWGDERSMWDFPSNAPSVFPLPRQRTQPQDQPEGVDLQNDEGSTFSKETGHFSQLVWRETTSVGCGRYQCDGEANAEGDGDPAPGWYVVCEYYPPGNVIGSFDENVLRGDYEGGAEGGHGAKKERVWWVVMGLTGVLLMQ